jgi:ribosomal protein S17E
MQLLSFKHNKQKVMVYRNLHNKCWSVKAFNGVNTGKVLFHADMVVLSDAKFSVNKRGRQRVVDEQCKNVHAGVVGYLSHANVINVRYELEHIGFTHDCKPVQGDFRYAVTYNPYKHDTFIDMATGNAVVEEGLLVTLDHSMCVWVEGVSSECV